MKKLAVFAVAVAFAAASAFAGADGIGNTYISANGTWYLGSGAASGTGVPQFAEGATAWSDLGTISSLILGGSFQAWDQTAPQGWGGGEEVWMHYAIDNTDPWIGVTMTYDSFGYGEYQNNMLFLNKEPVNVDISSYVDDGETHTINVWFGPVDGHYDPDGTNYSANFKAVSAAVPEPATMSLLGLGALAMALRRKLRK